MKILLHSFTFHPKIGGVENVSRALAELWARLGHQVTVITDTEAQQEISTDYTVVRNPDEAAARKLIESHDIVHSNGTSMRYFWDARQASRPFTWTHPTYQAVCLDGFGWVNDRPAPLAPLDSLLHHCRLSGPRKALQAAARMDMRRTVASLVSANVAVSHHQANILSLPRQQVIYNPIDPELFAVEDQSTAEEELISSRSTLAYLGRLISEKGVSDLLKAFAKLLGDVRDASLKLKIIGDGPQRSALEALAKELGVDGKILWTGDKSGADLRQEIRQAGIFILPSAWQEPMGITAVELMASGKPIIVSASGGLSECGGNACRTFPNGNIEALARVITEVQSDPQLQQRMVSAGLNRARQFDPLSLATQYIDLFAQVTGKAIA